MKGRIINGWYFGPSRFAVSEDESLKNLGIHPDQDGDIIDIVKAVNISCDSHISSLSPSATAVTDEIIVSVFFKSGMYEMLYENFHEVLIDITGVPHEQAFPDFDFESMYTQQKEL